MRSTYKCRKERAFVPLFSVAKIVNIGLLLDQFPGACPCLGCEGDEIDARRHIGNVERCYAGCPQGEVLDLASRSIVKGQLGLRTGIINSDCQATVGG